MHASLHWLHAGNAAERALLYLCCSPLLYIGTALMIWTLARNATSERKFFGIRLTKVLKPVLLRGLQSVLAGMVLAAAAAALGVMVAPWEVWAVTGVSLALALYRVRFMYLTYAVGFLAVLAVAARWVPEMADARVALVVHTVSRFRVGDWLALVGLASLLNAVLVWFNRRSGSVPTAIISKRGGALGAYLLQLGFVAPVVLAAQGSDAAVAGTPSWWPWLSSAPQLFTLVSMPVVLGFDGVFTTAHPARGVRPVVWAHSVLGLALLTAAYLYRSFPIVVTVVGAVLALAGMEALFWQMRKRQSGLDPLFVECADGVRVLGTVHGSLAERMGLKPGEVVTHVNQVPVHSKYDLHFAFEQNPAYVKLQVRDLRGETRFVSQPVYAGERHQLGIIFVPDTRERVGYQGVTVGLFQTIYLKAVDSGTRPGPSVGPLDSQTETL